MRLVSREGFYHRRRLQVRTVKRQRIEEVHGLLGFEARQVRGLCPSAAVLLPLLGERNACLTNGLVEYIIGIEWRQAGSGLSE